jgi:hypothetical protein
MAIAPPQKMIAAVAMVVSLTPTLSRMQTSWSFVSLARRSH